MKKILLSILLFFIFLTPTYALEIKSKNVVLYNLDTKEQIYGLNENKKVSIASLTKIMTNIVAIEKIKDLDQEITITSEMLKGLKEKDIYVIGLKEKQKVTYRDLIYASLLESGADASNAIAIGVSRSTDKYVELMNAKAKELELKQTSFANPIGLDDKNNYSTATEMAKILMYSYNNQTFKKIFQTHEYQLSDKSMVVKSSYKIFANKSKINLDYVLGAKTGYDIDAGRCLASIAYDKKNNIHYLLVTIHAPNSYRTPYHLKDASNIYTYYFKNYKNYKLVSKNDLLKTLKTKYCTKNKVNFYAKDDILYYSKNDFKKDNIKLEYIGKEILTSKNKKNDKIGKINVYYKKELIKSIDLVLEDNLNFDILSYLKTKIYYLYQLHS